MLGPDTSILGEKSREKHIAQQTPTRTRSTRSNSREGGKLTQPMRLKALPRVWRPESSNTVKRSRVEDKGSGKRNVKGPSDRGQPGKRKKAIK